MMDTMTRTTSEVVARVEPASHQDDSHTANGQGNDEAIISSPVRCRVLDVVCGGVEGMGGRGGVVWCGRESGRWRGVRE